MEHQDWSTVVFNKKSTDKDKTNEKESVSYNTNPKVIIHTGPKVKKLDDGEEVISVKLVTKEMSTIIKDKRNELKMTQKELGQKCNLDSKIINEIEKGGCLYVAEQKNKISRVLGVKIPREFK